MRHARRFATAAALLLTVAGISACSGAEPTATPQKTPPAVEPEEQAEPEPDEAEVEPADGGAAASWANPVTTNGELLTTLAGTGFTVDVYQVGVTQATRSGLWVDPDTQEPIIAEGSDIVFVNYVVTNTGSESLTLGSLLIQVEAKYDDWPYLQGMDTVSDFDLYEQMGVNVNGARPDAYADPYVLVFEPGTQYSVGSNFAHQPASPITFTATLVPVDENGELLHDARQEVTGQATIA